MRNMVTDFGKPLLEVCIRAEKAYHWPLKQCMSTILDEFECDPNVFTFDHDINLLTYAVCRGKWYRSWQSFDMLLEKCQHSLDPNLEC